MILGCFPSSPLSPYPGGGLGWGFFVRITEHAIALVAALAGDRAPFSTGGNDGVHLREPTGYKVVRVDLLTHEITPFVHNVRLGPASDLRLGGSAIERPVAVKFGPDGSLYILDYGQMRMEQGQEAATTRESRKVTSTFLPNRIANRPSKRLHRPWTREHPADDPKNPCGGITPLSPWHFTSCLPPHIFCRPLIASDKIFRLAYSILLPAGRPRASRESRKESRKVTSTFLPNRIANRPSNRLYRPWTREHPADDPKNPCGGITPLSLWHFTSCLPPHIFCLPLIASDKIFRLAYSILLPAGRPRASRVTCTFGNRSRTTC